MSLSNYKPNELYEKHLDNVLEVVSKSLAYELFDDIPSNNLLGEQITEPSDLLGNIHYAIATVHKQKKHNSIRYLLVAAVVIVLIGIIGAFSVTAFRINIFNSVIEIKNTAFQYLQENKPKLDRENADIKTSTYDDLYKAKSGLKFTCLMPNYIPVDMKYDAFEILKNGKRLDIYFNGNGKSIRITQEYSENMVFNKGSSLDTKNTTINKIDIMGKITQVFFVKDSSIDSMLIKWNYDNSNITIRSNLDIDEIKKIIEGMNKL